MLFIWKLSVDSRRCVFSACLALCVFSIILIAALPVSAQESAETREEASSAPSMIDPFRPFLLPMPESKPLVPIIPRTPCQRVDLAQLKLVAIIHDREVGSSAIFETPENETCTLYERDLIGQQDAVLKYILHGCVVIYEEHPDRFGKGVAICKCIDVRDEDICPLCVSKIDTDERFRQNLYGEVKKCETDNCEPLLFLDPPYNAIQFYCKCREGDDETCSRCLANVPDAACLEYALEIDYKEASTPSWLISVDHTGPEALANFKTPLGETITLGVGDRNEPEDAVVRYILNDCVVMEGPNGIFCKCVDFTEDKGCTACLQKMNTAGTLKDFTKFRAEVLQKVETCLSEDCTISFAPTSPSEVISIECTCTGDEYLACSTCLDRIDADECLRYGIQVHAKSLVP